MVCLEESLFIHNIRGMKVLHTIRETPPNKNGLCALSIDSDHCYLAYPGHSSVGELQIFDALHLVRITFLESFCCKKSPNQEIGLRRFSEYRTSEGSE